MGICLYSTTFEPLFLLERVHNSSEPAAPDWPELCASCTYWLGMLAGCCSLWWTCVTLWVGPFYSSTKSLDNESWPRFEALLEVCPGNGRGLPDHGGVTVPFPQFGFGVRVCGHVWGAGGFDCLVHLHRLAISTLHKLPGCQAGEKAALLPVRLSFPFESQGCRKWTPHQTGLCKSSVKAVWEQGSGPFCGTSL